MSKFPTNAWTLHNNVRGDETLWHTGGVVEFTVHRKGVCYFLDKLSYVQHEINQNNNVDYIQVRYKDTCI